MHFLVAKFLKNLMEETIDAFTQCPFEDANFIDKIRHCIFEVEFDPLEYEEAKSIILEAIKAIEDPETDKNLIKELKK